MSPLKIFVIEDDPFYAKYLKHNLSLNADNEVTVFMSGKALLDHVKGAPDVITLDYSLPDLDGLTLIKRIKSRWPDVPVIVISAQEDVSTAIGLLKEGAYDYIVKQDETKDRLWALINRIRENVSLKDQLHRLQEEVAVKYDFSNIKGNSSAIQRIFKLIEKAATSNITVSITGDTGTGKELVAKAIHYNSKRKNKPFVAVNIAAIPNELIESELFGHEKGSFTGAVSSRKGKFEEAHNGTLFLDEIGEMDIHLQAKLLRALQEKEISRVGSNKVQSIDVRVICATHRNLGQEVRVGKFREDLYYRLLGLPIALPPLRERENDVLILAKAFLTEFCKDNGLSVKSLTEAAKKKLVNYHWPGNVRELRATIELATVLSDRDKIDADSINFDIKDGVSDVVFEEGTLKDYTRKIIQFFLEKYDHNVVEVAKRLDIGKSTIYRMIKDRELEL